MNPKITTLEQPIYASSVVVPLVIRTVTPRADAGMYVAGGVPSQGENISEYILVSALPPELRERVVTAINAMLQG